MNTAREEIIHAVERLKIIVIIRGITGDTLLRTVDAIARGGIGLAEITFDQSGKTYCGSSGCQALPFHGRPADLARSPAQAR